MKRGKEENKKLIIRLIVFILAIIMIAGFVIVPFIYADDLSEKQGDLRNLNDEISKLEQALKSGKSTVSELKKRIKDIEGKVYSAQQKYNALTSELNGTKQLITKTLAELDNIQSRMDEQTGNLNMRLRAMYKNGSIGILSVLLGSDSMSSFLTNMEMAKRIYNSDEELLETIQDEHALVSEKKNELVQLKERLLTQTTEVKSYKASLDKSEAQLAEQKQGVEKSNRELEAQIDSLNEEADRLAAEILKLQSKGEYTGGVMCWPSRASRRITSPFGNRIHPILRKYKFHTGIDIGAGMGTDILAANNGRVIASAYNAGGYGYYIMLDHGGGIVTLYAHCSKLLVSNGEVVVRGQTIAKVGSTGMSTGAHIHFEVRINGKYVDPLAYVTAGKY